MLKSVLKFVDNPPINRITLQALPCRFQQSKVSILNLRSLHLTSSYLKEDKRAIIKAQPKKDEGTDGERVIDIDNIVLQ